MACRRWKDKETGITGMICGRGSRRRVMRCKFCGAEAEFQCDKIIDRKVCNVSMCEKHRHPVAPGVDFCEDHKRKEES